jgi:folate-binding protein YgfZ
MPAIRTRSGLTAAADGPIHSAVTIASDIEEAAAPAAASGSGRLPHMGALRFSGPDAVGFLQGQVSNDTAPLSRGAPVLAAYSTPQGRVLAILHLLPHSAGILGILPRDVAASTLERLRRFVLRAKVKIEDVSEQIAVVGIHGGAPLAACALESPGTTGYLEKDGIGVARVRGGAAPASASERYWLVGEHHAIARVTLAGDPGLIERHWRLGDIRDGQPQVYAATSESFVAQMLNLDLIGGISFSKGCYTGQEIIARTQHLGRIKRRMSRLRLPAASWAIGQPIRLADGRTGRLTELARGGEGFEALAVLSLDAAAAEAQSASTDATAAEQLPLPYRLD